MATAPQVKYSESGRRDNAREEAAAKRECGALKAVPRMPPPERFPWHQLSPGARFTPKVRPLLESLWLKFSCSAQSPLPCVVQCLRF